MWECKRIRARRVADTSVNGPLRRYTKKPVEGPNTSKLLTRQSCVTLGVTATANSGTRSITVIKMMIVKTIRSSNCNEAASESTFTRLQLAYALCACVYLLIFYFFFISGMALSELSPADSAHASCSKMVHGHGTSVLFCSLAGCLGKQKIGLNHARTSSFYFRCTTKTFRRHQKSRKQKQLKAEKRESGDA